MIQYDRNLGAFVALDDTQISDVDRLNAHLIQMRSWLDLKMANGRYSHGLLVDICVQSFARVLSPHHVFDEIGCLEGYRSRPTMTKKATQLRGNLRGLWHKHYFQARHMPKNLIDEMERMEREGTFRSIFEPHFGKYIEDCIDEISHEYVVRNFERRAARKAITGEFIVFERLENGSNYYITLGVHGEWDAIRARVDADLPPESSLILM